jgi:hypothetical protein
MLPYNSNQALLNNAESGLLLPHTKTKYEAKKGVQQQSYKTIAGSKQNLKNPYLYNFKGSQILLDQASS